MNEKDVKLVCVVRKDLGMRQGKTVVQSMHGIVGVYRYFTENVFHDKNLSYQAFSEWNNNGMFKKVCVSIPSLDELIDLTKEAERKNIFSYLVTDNGLTEFHGNKTITVGLFGPYFSEVMDELTGHLKLL